MPSEISTFDGLVDRAATLHRSAGRRVIIGLCGSPGAGKTTLALRLVQALGPVAAHLPMDGFHLSNEVLRTLGSHDRKGAPDTFDSWGYVALLRRIRAESENPVYAPRFHREFEESYAAEVTIGPEIGIVVTEGNYLLLDAGAWSAVPSLLDEAWFCTTSGTERHRRLVDRHLGNGRSAADATAWATEVDGPNGDLIDATARRADLLVPGDLD